MKLQTQSQIPQFDLGLPLKIESCIKNLLGLRHTERIYLKLRTNAECAETPQTFCRRALEYLGVSFDQPHTDELQNLRQVQGPIVFIANHPFGAIDALILMIVMGEVRSQFKLMGNAILSVLPELEPVLLPLEIMEENRCPGDNVAVLRKTWLYLNHGGMIGLFPAGEVAAFSHWTSKKVVERPWSSHLGRLVKSTEATVIPIYFEGRNSLLFQYLGLFAPSLRIALLVREMLKFRTTIRFRLGKPILPSEFAKFTDPDSLTNYLRERTFSLEKTHHGIS